ncbi:hypothetical protein Cfor_10125, partial [Coptotermes formosanus]
MVPTRCLSRAGALLIITVSLIAVAFCAPEGSPKRAPSGFLGVRGKKDSGLTSDESYNDVIGKRAPAMGFQGVRGKKDADSQQEILQDFLEKRGPSMGFMGMRGKKDPVDFDYFEKRAPPLGFQGMRGKKDLGEEESEMFKRAPSAGFQGVRGKKDGGYYSDKRFGFMGMRGKKDMDMEGDDYPQMFSDEDIWGNQEDVLEDSEELNKRVPSAGFFGMRGKKVPAAGFFGMRGKKGPAAGFFAMRGKKAPLAGFMGMRGKKESEGTADRVEDLETLLQYLGATYQLGRDKRNGERTPASKKAPSGFLGTRGKKNWPAEQDYLSDMSVADLVFSGQPACKLNMLPCSISTHVPNCTLCMCECTVVLHNMSEC